MKKLFFLLTVVCLTFSISYVFSQQIKVPGDNSLKARGLIPLTEQVIPVEPIPAIMPTEPGTRTLGLKVPLDETFTQVSFLPDYTGGGGYYTDDGSTGLITLPFQFCFYGTNETGFYLNNNGNVSFFGPYSTFTSSGFPIASHPMLAPFWADVDTRLGFGSVWMKMTSTAVIVIWNQVGYYANHGDKRNKFELIFTNGSDPLLATGNNVAFSYSTMQWTAGDGSLGSGGFGGVPATVGFNKGDGVNYAVVGRFDHAGNDYDGPGGENDGVGYLTYKYFEYNTCTEDVNIGVPISVVPISNWALFIGIGLILIFAVIRFRRLI
jgi:hypothetical protein